MYGHGFATLTLAGNYAYILAEQGLVVVNIDDPVNPAVAAVVDERTPS